MSHGAGGTAVTELGFIVVGVVKTRAHVAHAVASCSTSACVGASTLPATVVLAFGCVLPADIALHAPQINWYSSPSVESYTILPSSGHEAVLCAVVRLLTFSPGVVVPVNPMSGAESVQENDVSSCLSGN